MCRSFDVALLATTLLGVATCEPSRATQNENMLVALGGTHPLISFLKTKLFGGPNSLFPLGSLSVELEGEALHSKYWFSGRRKPNGHPNCGFEETSSMGYMGPCQAGPF
jgi:hypothetical protein